MEAEAMGNTNGAEAQNSDTERINGELIEHSNEGTNVDDVSAVACHSVEKRLDARGAGDGVAIDGTLKIYDGSQVGGGKVLELICKTESTAEGGNEIEQYCSRFEENNIVGEDGLLISKRQFEESATKSCLTTQEDGSEVIASSELKHREDERITKSGTGKILAEYSELSEEVHEQTTCTFETVGDQVKKTAKVSRRGSVSSSMRREGDEMAAIEASAAQAKKNEKFIVSFNSDTSDSEDDADVSVSATLKLVNGDVSSESVYNSADQTDSIGASEVIMDKKDKKKEKKEKKTKKEIKEEVVEEPVSTKKEKKSKKKDKTVVETVVKEPEVTKEKKKKKKDKDKEKEEPPQPEVIPDPPKKEKKKKKKDRDNVSTTECEEEADITEKKSKKKQKQASSTEITSEKTEKTEKKSKKEKKTKEEVSVNDTNADENMISIGAKIDSSCESGASAFNFAAAFSQSVSEAIVKEDSFEARSSQSTDISSVTRDSGISVDTSREDLAMDYKVSDHDQFKSKKENILMINTESIEIVDDPEDDNDSVSTEASTLEDETIVFENTSDMPITINVEYDADGNVYVNDDDAERLGMDPKEVLKMLGITNENRAGHNEITEGSAVSSSTDGATESTKTTMKDVNISEQSYTSHTTTSESASIQESSETKIADVKSTNSRQVLTSDPDSAAVPPSPVNGHQPSPSESSFATAPQSADTVTSKVNESVKVSQDTGNTQQVEDNYSELSRQESEQTSNSQEHVSKREGFRQDNLTTTAQESVSSQEERFTASASETGHLSKQQSHDSTENYIKQAISSTGESSTRVTAATTLESSDQSFNSRQELSSKSEAITRDHSEYIAEEKSSAYQSSKQQSAQLYSESSSSSVHSKQTDAVSQEEISRASRSDVSQGEHSKVRTTETGQASLEKGFTDSQQSETRSHRFTDEEKNEFSRESKLTDVSAAEHHNNKVTRSTEETDKMAAENGYGGQHVEYNGVDSVIITRPAVNADPHRITSPRMRKLPGDTNAGGIKVYRGADEGMENGVVTQCFDDEDVISPRSDVSSGTRSRMIGQVRVRTDEDDPMSPTTRKARGMGRESGYKFDTTATDDIIKRILDEVNGDSESTASSTRRQRPAADDNSQYYEEDEEDLDEEGERFMSRAANLKQKRRPQPQYGEEEDYDEDEEMSYHSPRRYGNQEEYDDMDMDEPTLLDRRLASMGYTRTKRSQEGGQGSPRQRMGYGQKESQSKALALYEGEEQEMSRRTTNYRKKKNNAYAEEEERLAWALRPRSYVNPYLNQPDSDEEDRAPKNSKKRLVAYTGPPEPFIPDSSFKPVAREETRELVEERTIEIRSVVDKQTEVLQELKSASSGLDELDQEVRALKQLFIESSVRKMQLLDDIEALEAEMPDFGEEPPNKYRSKYGRGLGRSKSANAADYANYQNMMPSARDLALDRLGREIDQDSGKLGVGALNELARKDGFAYNKKTGEFEEVDDDGMSSVTGRSVCRFDDEEDEYQPTRTTKKYMPWDDDADSTAGSRRISRFSSLDESKDSGFSSTSTSSYRGRFARRGSTSCLLALEGPKGDVDGDGEQGIGSRLQRSLDDTSATSSYRPRFSSSSFLSKYGGSSSSTTTTTSNTDSADTSDTSIGRASRYGRFGRSNTYDSPSSLSTSFDRPDGTSAYSGSSSRFLDKVRQRKASGEPVSKKRDKPFKSRFLTKSFDSDSTSAGDTGTSSYVSSSATDNSGATD